MQSNNEQVVQVTKAGVVMGLVAYLALIALVVIFFGK